MSSLDNRKKNTALFVVGLVLFMVALSFASVPLYRLFCQKTGYGGTPKIVASPSLEHKISHRVIRVQFNADVNPHLPWRFKPLQREISVRVGQNALAFYQAENKSDQPIVGMATYNVTPEKAGKYFNKVICFCFLEQRLAPNQMMDMPVQFFLDPDFDQDPDLEDVRVITLSYTFFPFKKGRMPFDYKKLRALEGH